MRKVGLAVALSAAGLPWAAALRADEAPQLRPPAAFASIADPQARSAALFSEAGKVIADPRWGWDPGPGRRPVAGTQQQFGALIEAWIDTGAACP